MRPSPSRRAVAALEAMVLLERLLHRVHLASLARPSMVVTSLPSACTASTVHDFTDSPLRCTVHAPHDEVSHPMLVPVRPRASRRWWTRSVRGSTSLSWPCR